MASRRTAARSVTTAVAAVVEGLERRRLLSTVGPNVNISRSTGYEAETTIAIDPTNPNRMFAASNISGAGMRAAYSLDAGATWTSRTMASGADGLPVACCDPQSTFDRFGNLYLVYLNDPVNQVVIAVSTNAGQTFSTLATFAGSVDQPSIAVGGDVLSAANQSVWITYNLSGAPVAAGARITGAGTANISAFSAVQSSGGAGNFGDVAVGPGGEVVISWQNPSGGQGPSNVQMVRDANGLNAGGFGAISTITSTNVGGFDYIPAQSNRSVDAEANFAYDLSTGPRRGRLYMVYTDETVNENNDLDIFVRTSDDHGTTWSPRVRVNDDATTRSQFFSEIAVDPTSGKVAVAFYDARNDNGVVGPGSRDTTVNNDVQLWAAVSTDGGASFQPNIQVGPGVSNSQVIGNPNDFGDYNDIDFYGGVFYPIWADNSTTLGNNPGLPQPDLATARVVVTEPAGPRVTAAAPAGVVGSAASFVDFAFDRAMNTSSFSVASDVVSFTGPGSADLKPQITGFTWLSGTTLRVAFNAQSALGAYSMVIGPQILASVGGAAMDQDSDAVAGEPVDDRAAAAFTIAAPAVQGHTPTFQVEPPLTSIDLVFTQAMDPASFSVAADVVSFTGPLAADLKAQITGFTWLSGNTTLRISFTPQNNIGVYQLTVGPGILNTAGLFMNQDGDGTAGESVQDRYTAGVNLNPSIGPDGFGYVATATAGLAIDLVTGGPGVVNVRDNVDDGTASIPLGTNSFRFYGTAYSGTNQLFVSSNGLITFGSANSDYENTDMTSTPSQAAIAPLWDDWQTDTSTVDAVLYRFDDLDANGTPDQLVIEWNEVPHYRPTGPTAPGTFQAILQLNTGAAQGEIFLNYPDVNFDSSRASFGASASVGIKAAGTQGPTLASNRLLVTNNSDASPYLRDGRGIRIVRDTAAPVADVVDVTPDPRTTGVGTVLITFTEPVNNFNLADLTLTRNGGANLLTGSQTLTTFDNQTFTLGNLAGITATSGTYVLSLTAAGSGITDGANNALAAGASDTWVHALPAWLSAGSAATWNSQTKALTVTGAATIIADPGTDLPVIQASGGAAVLTINPAGDLEVHVGALNLAGGAAATVTSLGAARTATNHRVLVIEQGNLLIDATSKLNLTDNDLAIDYTGTSPYSIIRGFVVTGRNTGTGGITSSPGAGDTVLAVVDNTGYGRTSFDGLTIDGTTILCKYTYFGDANLDGKVTGDDYLSVDANLGLSGAQWFQGDFNFSGTTTGDDYLAIDAHLGKGTLQPLAYDEERATMIGIHAARYGGDSYIAQVEAAAAGDYSIGDDTTPLKPAPPVKGRTKPKHSRR